ncbi:hypothetical protein SLE2022_264400 [Rubroshorea leprosula]
MQTTVKIENDAVKKIKCRETALGVLIHFLHIQSKNLYFSLFLFLNRYLCGLKKMGSSGADKIPRDGEPEGSETTIEIKIKTLDSQTYTLRVDKQMPVPALKEQIASVTGVLSEQQRLICRGKVLKDDQLLSAYHVEDGHTLHLVVREPVPPSSDGSLDHSALDPGSGTSHSRSNHAGSSVLIETFNMPDQGDGVPPDISRIVSSILGSFGFANIGSSSNGVDVRGHGSQRLERTFGASSIPNSPQQQPEQAGTRGQSDRSHSTFGLPTAVSLGPLQPPVIPDSLATLSQYLIHMRREFDDIGRGTVQQGLPTPASLAEVLLSSRQMLIEQATECLLGLARQLEDQANVTDPGARLSTQSNAWRTGYLFHSLGSFLLELGRTTMTVRLGQTPSEAVVNAGPAVFISPSGPNPLMVQPLPFQPGTGFGAIPMGTLQPGSGLVNGIGTGFVPRRIDIQIRRGSSMTTPNAPNANREEHSDNQQRSAQNTPATGAGGENHDSQTFSRASDNPSFAGQSGVRVLPIRTMVAAVPATFGRLPSDSSTNSLGLYYPVLGRVQHVASGSMSASQAPGEPLSVSTQTEQHPVSESTVQQQNAERPNQHGSLANPNSRQQDRSNTRTVNINIISANGSGTQNNQESERQLPSSVLQFLRTIFPGGEIHVEDPSSIGMATVSAPEHASTSSNPSAAESIVTDQGVFLSNLLHQIMPFISQHAGQPQSDLAPEPEATSSTQAQNSTTGTSRRHSDSDSSAPSSKRPKTE